MSRYLEIKEKQPAGFSPSLIAFFPVYEKMGQHPPRATKRTARHENVSSTLRTRPCETRLHLEIKS
jgi:hypothetical protein